MIVNSQEWFLSMSKELDDLKRVLESKCYKSEIPFVMQGIDLERKVCDVALDSVKCNFCMHYENSPKRFCRVNGDFPDSIDPKEYSCVNWVYDDIPF